MSKEILIFGASGDLGTQISKIFLENNYKCKQSHANYVLFEQENIYTKYFGCRKIGGYYRMALADMKTLNLAK